MNLRDKAASLSSDLAELRHGLHREPEVGLQVPRTQQKVISALTGLPLEITTGDRLTSVTAVLRGGRPGPTVLLRADMDALQIEEKTDVPFRSQTANAMHACGHDLHTAMLVGAAHLLAGCRDELAGSVVFMFQPGEEACDGAGHMIAEGVLEAAGARPVAAYAMHVMSRGWAHGTFTTRPGPMMAASDALTVTVRGTGGHGSAPHLARDPVLAACEMTLALQSFLSRSVDPMEPAVLTVGSFHSGTRRNVIPETATFDATVRTFSQQVRDRVARDSVRVCEGIAAAHGLDVDAVYSQEYPVTINAEPEAALAAETVAALFGPGRFEPMARPIMGSEDFSRIIEAVPGAMVFLGAAPPGEDYTATPNNHSQYATFDDGVLSAGAALYAGVA
ncbi:MAG TPA: M20 family metallopeptidase, partial [Trebonia sp.]